MYKFSALAMKGIGVAVVGIAMVLVSSQAFAAISYSQGFEADTFDWSGVTRVATGTNGVLSAAGAWHAEATSAPAPSTSPAFTRFGGYESVFPAGGYTTSMAIYLNVGAGNANDTRFDWSSAINTPAPGPGYTHRRDFVFNAGFYNDTDATGTGPRFVVSASNNATRSGAFPKNPGRDPFTIASTGWYTFEHRFYAVAGVLRVDLTIRNTAGVALHTWTLSDASDVIGVTVGGHRYGWLVIQEFPVLAIDSVLLRSINPPANMDACKDDGWQSLTRADGSVFMNQGDCVSYAQNGR
jgi:hypothetical protein